jgi:serine/threonine protein kinase
MKKIVDNVEFEIIDLIAEGGMGAVYKACQKGVEGFRKTVAIKTLLAAYSSDQKFIDMFKDEAHLVANLVHENIVQIYQLGKYDENYYFVLEYVDGVSLHEFQAFHKNLYVNMPQNLAVFIASRIARGLAYAHSRCDSSGNPLKIVHCDVCPNNVLITTEGLPKLTDFGIAKAVNMANNTLVSGKLPFMSPEQANGKEVDFRSDIYSLGVVLFNLLCGDYTRDIKSSLNDIFAQAKENYIAWHKLENENVDEDLMAILWKMLATDPNDRHQKTDELARDLEYYIYKDGYGPTIVTLSNYMRKQMPYLYSHKKGECEKAKKIKPGDKTTFIDKTTRIEF